MLIFVTLTKRFFNVKIQEIQSIKYSAYRNINLTVAVRPFRAWIEKTTSFKLLEVSVKLKSGPGASGPLILKMIIKSPSTAFYKQKRGLPCYRILPAFYHFRFQSWKIKQFRLVIWGYVHRRKLQGAKNFRRRVLTVRAIMFPPV